MTERMTVEQYRRLKLHKTKKDPLIKAKKTLVGDEMIDSIFEAKVYTGLLAAARYGDAITDLKRQVKFEVKINGEVLLRYKADFTYLKNGVPTIHEAKGFPNEQFPLRWKAMRLSHPEYDFILSTKKGDKTWKRKEADGQQTATCSSPSGE